MYQVEVRISGEWTGDGALRTDEEAVDLIAGLIMCDVHPGNIRCRKAGS